MRNGTSLEELISWLEEGRVNPVSTSWLVFKMAKASWRDHETGRWTTKFYTFDHRRLYCMCKAGIKTVRAKIAMQGPDFDEFVRKADSFGIKPSQLHVRHGRILTKSV